MGASLNEETAVKLRGLRERILRAAAVSREGHIASGFSILDILWVLYDKVLNVDPSHPEDPVRDRFVLSKGHASLGLYAILAEKGFFSWDELDRFGAYDGILGGHPDINKVPGVESSTGSLGHGMPMAVGRALALKTRASDSRVYCLIGDGEANEGTIWESMLLGAHHKLSKLCCVCDFNHSTDRALDLGDLEAKFRAFGWETVVVDGHDHNALLEAFVSLPDDRPKMIVANTIKGKGCPSMENNPAWHHKSPADDSELEALIAELQ